MQAIISEAHGPLLFVPVLPSGYKGPVLPGSQALSCSGDFGSIVVQNYSGLHFNIRYIILRLFQKLTLHRREEEKLRAQFVLQENLKYKRERTTLQVKTGEYNLVWAPGKDTVFQFSKEREYHLMHIEYEPELIQQLLPSFPDPDSIPHEKDIQLIKPHYREAIDQLLAVPYKDNIRRFYFENQVRDLLFYILFSEKEQKNVQGLSEQEVAQVSRVEQMILRDLTVHYTIPELARKAKMGQFRLKAAFKKVTGMGLFERLKEARLQRARALLLETDWMVRTIYAEVGYESITGFIDAFRGRFGISPTDYRKKYKPKD